MAATENANVVFSQLAPWQFDYSGEKMNIKRTFRRVSCATARLLGNMGVGGETPLLGRFSSPVAKGEQRWLKGYYLDVPEEHLKDHSAVPAFEHASPEAPQDVVRIRSGKDKPESSFAAVNYRGHWFWIDDGDWQTKRALTAVMFFFTLAETGSPEKLPLITIPAQ